MPYGTGDANLATTVTNNSYLDDGSSPQIKLTTALKFFNETYQTLWVNINGAISFNSVISKYTPECKPLTATMAMISPFWADVDLRSGRGVILYRQTTEKAVLDKAREDVVAAFPKLTTTLNLHWAFVATWVDVPFYDANACKNNLTNTFQLTLTTDGIHSFALFYYNKIQWTTGTASGALGCSGKGGSPARAGFDNGEGES